MLHKKMLRDLLKNKVAYLACSVIIAIGLMIFVSMENTYINLNKSMNYFYNEYNFADAFATVESMPLNHLRGITDIPGIEQVSGKLVKDVRVLFSDREDNVYLRLVSVDLEENERLNDIWLMEGTELEKSKRNIWTGIKFYDANELNYGDDIEVIINGKVTELNVIGKAQSPEHVYVMKDITDFYPSDKEFGVAYIPYDVMETLFDFNGTINEISFKVDSSHSFEDIKSQLESRLKKYNVSNIVERKDQLSNFMLAEEMKQIEKMSSSIPILFLIVAAIILWIMLKRMVEHQRMQIGTLKASGYSSFQILMHYVSYSVVIGIIGGIVGGVFGFIISDVMIMMYQDIYSLPNLESEISVVYFLMGIIISVIFSSIAGVLGARGVLKLEPAESMCPPAPVSGKKILLENVNIFWEALTVQGKMAVRNIFRSKGRSLFTCMGIAFAFSLMAALFSFVNMFDVIIMDTFEYVQKYDMKVTFYPLQNVTPIIRELEAISDVDLAEPMWEVPVTLTNEHRKNDTIILGLKSNSELYHVVDEKKHRVTILEGGIMLAEPLAKKLDAKIGDILDVETPFTQKENLQIGVANIVPQYIGTNGFMILEDLNALLGHRDAGNSVLLRLPQESTGEIKNRLNESKIVTSIEEIDQTREKYAELMEQAFIMLYVMALMAILTGFAIIYNSGLISFSERERELASLRVMGMSNGEVMEVLSFEQIFLGIVGIVVGIPLTYFYNYLLVESFETDFYNFPMVVKPEVFLYALLGTVLATFFAYLSIRKRVKNLSMVEVLKERE
ncbi:FtsX-like permease family protein [Herbivorax sp. ANBcel31]|uniref:ABC transporter permease n=1 Tax=Herbivorax sp. ANBcel31 TaxID=3069754 RepID=UPI0027B17847|nr:ABC transporter permease [Herbivorax sp. ANBcel31]MDQ2086240.1 FtsX-like permease family protein [Herbivorax sp. ANBcel31]